MLPNGPYNPIESEKAMLNFWLENKFYKPEFDPSVDKVKTTEEMKSDVREAWALICPPPNAYARPHIGNISGYAYQDAMARYARMQGKKVLVLPGKDHAGLEGEGVFVREVLEKQGRNKFEMKREDFYKEMMEFFMKNIDIAAKDEREIGLSADFDRDTFTLDPNIVETVLNTFVEMYKDQRIYKGVRIINWDPKARTAVADNQCLREERDGKIYYIKYKIKDSDKFITVATTRPETMFGDTAVAVNPKDKRYADLIGKTVIIPLVNIEIPIITNPKVLTDFGTGVLKITPAHAQDDYQIMMEWNAAHPEKKIGYRNVVSQDLKLVGTVPEKYRGRKYKEALPEIIEDLNALGQFDHDETVKQNILITERTKAVVEPLMSSQWYLKYDGLKEAAIDMVKTGDVQIHPDNMIQKFNHWMDNLRDWAISRSLWWGYRLPVWYAGDVTEEINDDGQVTEFIEINGRKEELNYSNPNHLRVQMEKPIQLETSNSQPATNWIQDENVLDTWFSSGQWVYATLTKYNLMDTFFPTTVLVSASDILENWDSRMMMFTYFKHKKEPFKNLFLTGIVLGKDGQKMSKSKGNVLDVDQIKNEYGSDALRMSYFYQNSAGGSYVISPDKLKNFKQFNNKLWNAAKFVTMDFDNESYTGNIADLKLDLSKQIIEHIKAVKEKVTKNIDAYEFGYATETLYDEFWHKFCDELIEQSKKHTNSVRNKETNEVISEPNAEEKSEMKNVLIYAIKEYTKMLHPFIPFITEAIWQEMPKAEGDFRSLMYTKW
ncbi:MAG: valine--tRNA ligase [Candidatus Dojkabacteria bacterium]